MADAPRCSLRVIEFSLSSSAVLVDLESLLECMLGPMNEVVAEAEQDLRSLKKWYTSQPSQPSQKRQYTATAQWTYRNVRSSPIRLTISQSTTSKVASEQDLKGLEERNVVQILRSFVAVVSGKQYVTPSVSRSRNNAATTPTTLKAITRSTDGKDFYPYRAC